MPLAQTELEIEDELEPVRAKFVELWAKWPDRHPNEIAEAALTLCGLEPGFRFMALAQRWSSDLLLLAEVDKLRRLGGQPEPTVPTKEEMVAELIALARDPKVDAKDRNTAYKTALEAMGHITKQVSKETTKKPSRPPAILFKAVDFNTDPEPEDDGEGDGESGEE